MINWLIQHPTFPSKYLSNPYHFLSQPEIQVYAYRDFRHKETRNKKKHLDQVYGLSHKLFYRLPMCKLVPCYLEKQTFYNTLLAAEITDLPFPK